MNSMYGKTIPFLFIAGALSACSPVMLAGLHPHRPLLMTYISDPPGAMVYEGDKAWGRAPVALNYPASVTSFRANQCLKLNPITFRWVSGAEAHIDLTACPQQGLSQQYAMRRPKDSPGLEYHI